jgi:hypothetical protein
MAGMSFEQGEFLDKHIPYRLQNLDLFDWALQIIASDPDPCGPKHKTLQMVFDTGHTLSGSHGIFTNPAVETGLVTCRALLGFLEAKPTGHKDDVLITMFQRPNGENLSPVPLSCVAKFHPPEVSESKTLEALKFTKLAADKAVAHLTLGPPKQEDEDIKLYQISCLAIRDAVEHYLYGELGHPVPPRITKEFERGKLSRHRC